MLVLEADNLLDQLASNVLFPIPLSPTIHKGDLRGEEKKRVSMIDGFVGVCIHIIILDVVVQFLQDIVFRYVDSTS